MRRAGSAGRRSSETAARKPSARSAGRGTARGTPADAAYVAKQTADKRALLETLRALVIEGVPGATATIKWGVPVYAKDGRNVCALAVFKDHVGINFFAPPSALVDPGLRLEGAGKTSRMLKVRTPADIDSANVLRWLKAAAG